VTGRSRPWAALLVLALIAGAGALAWRGSRPSVESGPEALAPPGPGDAQPTLSSDPRAPSAAADGADAAGIKPAPGAVTRPSDGPATEAPGTARIEGTVRFAPGSPWRGAHVTIAPVAGGDVPLGAALLAGRHAWASPKFVIESLPPGRYRVGAGIGMGTIAVRADLDLVAGTNSVSLDVPDLLPSEYVVVDVLGPEGRIADASIDLRVDNLGGFASTGTAERQSDGTWWVPLATALLEPAGVQSVVVRTHLGAKTVAIAPGTERLDVRFEEPATLEVVVHPPLPVAEEWLGVSVSEPAAMASHPALGPIDGLRFASGKKSFGPLAAGEYVLRLVALESPSRSQAVVVSERPIRLAPGRNDLRVERPETSDLRLRSAARRFAWFELEPAAVVPFYGTRLSVSGDDEGRATYRSLPHGKYVVRVYTREDVPDAEIAIEHPSPTELVIEGAAPSALEAVIDDPKGVLASQGLRTGDRIVAFDGKSFSGSEEIRRAVLEVSRRPRVRAAVRRGRETLDLELDPRVFWSRPAAGGSLLRVSDR